MLMDKMKDKIMYMSKTLKFEVHFPKEFNNGKSNEFRTFFLQLRTLPHHPMQLGHGLKSSP